MGQSCLVRVGGGTKVRDLEHKMLYPVLKWASTFPLGSHSEGLDLLQREVSSRHLRARSEDPFVPNNEEIGRMKREFFTPDPTFSRPTFYYPRHPDSAFSGTHAFYDVSEQERRYQRPDIPTVNRFGINRPDPDIQFQSLSTRRGNFPQLHRSGCSSSYNDRSKYLPSTPKVRTQFPRFHTGFQY